MGVANSSDLVLQVVRPTKVSVVLDRADKPLGLELRFSAGSECVEIASIGRGAVEHHNAVVPSEQQVRRFDLIKSVSSAAAPGKQSFLAGSSGSAAILEELGKHGELRLELLRCPGVQDDDE